MKLVGHRRTDRPTDRPTDIVLHRAAIAAKNQPDGKIRLIFTHNEKNPPIHQWIRQSRKCLDRNEKAKDIGKNIQIAYKQPKNIKQLVGGPSLGGRGETKWKKMQAVQNARKNVMPVKC